MIRSVVLFGDSITRGQFSANYVRLLRRRMGSEGFVFKNYGVNNDTTYNLLHRTQEVVDCCPSFVTILIGTNDIIGALSAANAAFYMTAKGLPQPPAPDWSLGNVTEIIHQIKSQTQAAIGLASIPILGEDLQSPSNRLAQYYNAGLKKVAQSEEIAYIPIYERLANALVKGKKPQAYNGSVPLTAEFVFRNMVFHEDFNTFSRRKGFQFLVDGVHLNELGARLVADEMEAFLRQAK